MCIRDSRGSQFTSEMMSEVSRLLSIQQSTTSPYHAMGNGVVENFNKTMKNMLKKVAAGRPKDWHRYLTPLMFAVRDTPQDSPGFTPFELLYGRSVRTPMTILKELWTGEVHIISYIIRTNVLEHTRHTRALTVAQKHNETFQRNSTELKS